MKKSGISLVSLVITIIVLIILTATVILLFNQGGITNKAKEAVFKSDFSNIAESFTMNKNKLMMDNLGNMQTKDAYTPEKIKECIPIFSEQETANKEVKGKKYIDLVQVYNSKLYQENAIKDDEIIEWLDDVGIPKLPNEIIKSEEYINGFLEQEEENVAEEIKGRKYIDLVQVYNSESYQKDNINDDKIEKWLDDIGISKLPNEILNSEEYINANFSERINEVKDNKKFLYKYGEKYNDITGGWKISYNPFGTKKVKENGDNVYFEVTNTDAGGAYGAHAAYATNNRIDVTKYNKIIIALKDIKVSDNTSIASIIFSIRDTNAWVNNSYYIANVFNNERNGNKFLEIDVSNISGSYYVNFCVNADGNRGNIKTTTANLVAVWME